MPILTSMALVAILLAIGGYAAGAWRSRIRERELTSMLAERNEELQAARAEIARLSSQDALTALATYPHFQQFLEGEWRRASRELTPISLISIELDHLSSYRAGWGRTPATPASSRSPRSCATRSDGRAISLAVTMATSSPSSSPHRQRRGHALAVKLRAAVEALEIPSCITRRRLRHRQPRHRHPVPSRGATCRKSSSSQPPNAR